MSKLQRWLSHLIFLIKPSNIECVINTKPIMHQKCLFTGQGSITFGDNVQLGWKQSPYFYSTYGYIEARNLTSQIYIGDDTIINNNCSIISNGEPIFIGKNCRIGLNFQCIDSDFHGKSINERDNQHAIEDRPVRIGDNVFIGNNVIILKGSAVGNGSIVAASSVVTKQFGGNSIIGGNPAKQIGIVNG